MVFGNHKKDQPCRWRRRKEARPEEILEAALCLFTEKGFAATRMNDVAKLAGISKGTLYLYFESKEAIFHAVIQEMITPKIAQVEKLVEQHQGSNAELLKLLILNWWKDVLQTQLSAIPKLMVSECGNFPELGQFFVNTVVKRARAIFARVIRQGIEQNEFIRQDPDTLARLVMAPIVQGAIWTHSLKQFDDDQDMDEYIDMHILLIEKSLVKHKGCDYEDAD
ncbi:MAG: TetR/AcrR family transcriptional regulator [Gammaproteobacteria bacterium]|nr:TetR/AcrR family transcriptional regulator [Gammaproteobacteria bacterium]